MEELRAGELTSTSDDYQVDAPYPALMQPDYEEPWIQEDPAKESKNSGYMVAIIGAAAILGYLVIT